MPSRKRVAIFDRDGVLNIPSRELGLGDYITHPSQIVWVSDSLHALSIARACDVVACVATNQSCIGKGIVTRDEIGSIHHKMTIQSRASVGQIDNFFVCPHTPDDNCDCRKPKPGLLIRAATLYGVEIEDCVFLGDMDTDAMAAEACGMDYIHIDRGMDPDHEIRRIGNRDVSVYRSTLLAVRQCGMFKIHRTAAGELEPIMVSRSNIRNTMMYLGRDDSGKYAVASKFQIEKTSRELSIAWKSFKELTR